MTAALLFAAAAPATAQNPPAVTLAAAPAEVDPGQATELSGAVSPAEQGTTVAIVDHETGATVLQAVTNPDGTYAASFTPERTTVLRADWRGVSSEIVTVEMVAPVSAVLGPVRLFDDVTVSGRVRPIVEGATVEVRLLVGGRETEAEEAPLRADGSYLATFRVEEIGWHRAEVTYAPEGSTPGEAQTEPKRPPLPRLARGAHSPFVRSLEERLDELNYRITGINEVFDERTADAVLAFHKVQGMERTQIVTAATWRALADPKIPRPRATVPGFHVEIDQTKQVIYTVAGGVVTNIVHTSTGAGGATRDGVFSVHSKIAGHSPNGLYYPSYFDGARATHGWPEVPSYPASHGCARVPNWTAVWLFNLMPIGTEVRVYH
jgi:hypothetical protein